MAADFPCGVCKNECENNVIQCSQCETWLHHKCIRMTKTALKSWAAKSVNFYCESCSFTDGFYDAEKALQRLQLAMQSKKKNALDTTAKNELKLLQLYKVSLPCIDTTTMAYSMNEIDPIATEILMRYHPAYLEVKVPLETYGDGNCLYRAVSKSLTGSEAFHKFIRLEAALELIIFKDHYDQNSKNKLSFLTDSRIITSNINKLIHDAVKLGSYSELAHMYAVSSVLCQPIRSYYPPQLHPELTSEPFTRTVVGRDVRLSNASICIMWSTSALNENVNIFTPNHFVPIVNKYNRPSSKPIVVDDSPVRKYLPSKSVSTQPVSPNCSDNIRFDDVPDVSYTDVDDNDNMGDDVHVKANASDVNIDASQSDVEENVNMDDDVHVKANDSDVNINRSNRNNHEFDSDVNDVPDVSYSNIEQNDVTINDKVHVEANNFDENLDISSSDGTDDAEENEIKGKLSANCFMDTSKAVHLLTNSDKCFERIPSGIKENVYFVVDNEQNQIKRNGNGKSSYSDDCGVWLAQSACSPSSYYLLQENGDLKKIYFYKKQFCSVSRCKIYGKVKPIYTPFDPQPASENIINIRRYYAKSKRDPAYQKRVTWLGEGGLCSKYCIIEYIGQFPGLAPHGNSNNDKSEYLRTPQFVMEEAGECLKKEKPKLVYEELKEKYDELDRPTSLQQLRDKKKYEKCKGKPESFRQTNVADNILVLENMITHNHPFVRAVIRTSNKTPGIILYADEQIEDLKQFCCSGKTILGVDKTFNLCEMHVTVTCFKQLSVVRTNTSESPIFIGPIFLHDNSDFETYCHFFHHLKVKLIDSDLSNLVVGSDEERALVKAITTAFPQATHTLCTRHLRQNANQKLQDDAVDRNERDKLLSMIFGADGIINADDSICFEQKCEDLKSYCQDVTENFKSYFEKKLQEPLRVKVNEPVRKKIITAEWTNNNCESINHVLKLAVDWKSKSLVELAATLEKLVKGQYSDLRGALLGTGEFRLAATHLHFQTTKTDWISKSKDQRNRIFRKFRSYKPVDNGILSSTDGQSEIIAPRTHGRKPGQRKRGVNERTRTNKRTKCEK